MSVAAAQASTFYSQAAKNKMVYTFTDDESYLVLKLHDKEVVPFWSSASRVAKVIENHKKYSHLVISEETLDHFLNDTLSLFEEEKIHVGVNWSGPRLVGYDLTVNELKRNIEYWVSKLKTEG